MHLNLFIIKNLLASVFTLKFIAVRAKNNEECIANKISISGSATITNFISRNYKNTVVKKSTFTNLLDFNSSLFHIILGYAKKKLCLILI